MKNALLFLSACVLAAAQALIIPAWPGAAPGSEQWTQKEIEFSDPHGLKMVRNVVRPTLTAFLPDKATANGTAVVVCPGGAFRILSWESEGTEVAQWLQQRGVAAFVLKYRLVDTGATPQEFQKSMAELGEALRRKDAKAIDTPINIRAIAAADGRQAVRVVRERAAEWGISPERIGIMGFSAGGMVTMSVALEHEPASRPNFAASIYGAAPEGVPVPADAGPIFVLAASDDPLIPASAGIRIYSDWKAAGHSAELHLYSKGGHGFGMQKKGLPSDHWIDRFGDWLGAEGLPKAR
jgi:acetyl esterase/lipase